MHCSACAAGIVKAAFISNYGKTGDFLWDSANLTIWYSYVSLDLSSGWGHGLGVVPFLQLSD